VSRRCLSARDGHYAPQGVARLRELPGYGYPLGPHVARPLFQLFWRNEVSVKLCSQFNRFAVKIIRSDLSEIVA